MNSLYFRSPIVSPFPFLFLECSFNEILFSLLCSKRKANIGIFPLKFRMIGFHHNTALTFLASRTYMPHIRRSQCLAFNLFLYNVIVNGRVIFTELLLYSQSSALYVHVMSMYYTMYNVMYFTMYMYFTQLHHHVSDSAMSMARTRTALPFWMSLKNVMLWREGERIRWMQWFVQWYATGLLSMVIIFTSLSCHQS